MDMSAESKRQELAGRLVDREIYYCVSYLMSGIGKIMWERGFEDAFGYYPDDVQNLFVREDWEEPARYFIEQDADIDQLEEIADKYGYWSDVLEESGMPVVEEFETADGDLRYYFGVSDLFDDEDDARNEAIESVLPTIREKVWALVDAEAAGPREICDEYSLDPEQHEVYEHWIVSNWLAKRLEEYGEVTGEFADLTIWGRCTTGQSIALDWVMQKIARDLWPEEWPGDE